MKYQAGFTDSFYLLEEASCNLVLCIEEQKVILDLTAFRLMICDAQRQTTLTQRLLQSGQVFSNIFYYSSVGEMQCSTQET